MARRVCLCVLGFLALFIWSPPCPADTVSEGFASTRRIPGLVTDQSRVPANVTVFTAEDIRRSGVTTVQDILARAEGVSLLDTRGFGVGSDASLSLRGISNGSRTGALVLVDGIRQNQLTGDEVHWQSIPLDQIERIEIIRGGGGTIYGEGALSGVINITTKRDAERLLETETRAEIGTFGWQRYSLAARGQAKTAGYGMSYQRRLLHGYRDFSNSRNTTVTTHGRVELMPGVDLSSNFLHSEDTTNFPGGMTLTRVEQNRRGVNPLNVGVFDDETNQVSMDLALGPFDGLSWLATAFWRARNSDSRASRLFTLAPSTGMTLRSNYEWVGEGLSNVLVSGVELADDKASTGTRNAGRTDESNREGYGVYLEDTLTLWDRLSLVGGFRYDRSKFEEDIIAFDSVSSTDVNYVGTLHFEGKSPRLGLTYTVVPNSAWVFASYGRPFKAPNVDDFSSRSPEFRGNISLQPQQADTYELGARAARGPLRANTTAFYTRTQDEILFVQGIPGSPFLFQNRNFDTRRFGVEGGAHLDLPRLRGYATYAFMDAEFRKGEFSGRSLPATPEHLFNAGIGVSPLRNFWMSLDWQLVHDYFRINDVTNILPADNFGVLNMLLQYELPEPKTAGRWPHTKVYLKLNNITGEEYVAFQSSNGVTLSTGNGENPMPSFNVICGVTIDF